MFTKIASFHSALSVFLQRLNYTVLQTQISVIGCGWLGLPLAKHLLSKGYNINGSTTSSKKIKTLKETGIKAYEVCLSETQIHGNYEAFLEGSDTIIINIPPGLRQNPTKNHLNEMKHLVKAIDQYNIKNVLYISSTSVFKDEVHFPEITSKTIPNADTDSAKQLIAIENFIKAQESFNTTILRFSGLIDSHRHPGKFLAGKNNISNPDAPINLIHKHDCIAIITKIIEDKHWNITLNASYPIHPIKKAYYTTYTKTHNLPLPSFNSSEKSLGKIIKSDDLVQLLNYSLEHGL